MDIKYTRTWALKIWKEFKKERQNQRGKRREGGRRQRARLGKRRPRILRSGERNEERRGRVKSVHFLVIKGQRVISFKPES